MLSILISSFERLPLLRRVLWALENRPPTREPFELVLVDEQSNQSEDILGEVKGLPFPWTFVRFDQQAFERATGLGKYWNCCAATMNAGLLHLDPQTDKVALQGNEVIPVGDCYNSLLSALPKGNPYAWVASTTFDLDRDILAELDERGTNLSSEHIQRSKGRLLSTQWQPNLLSIFTRPCFDRVKGFDLSYMRGISAEDADITRRMRCLPGFAFANVAGAISLHQNHGGVSHLARPDASVISEDRLSVGVSINRATYLSWREGELLPAHWDSSSGVVEVIKGGRG